MRNASNTNFSTLSLALTLLLDEINACPTTLCGFNFQSVDTQLFKSIKEYVSKRLFKRECCCNVSMTQLVGQYIIICRGQGSNPGHPTYSSYKLNSSH